MKLSGPIFEPAEQGYWKSIYGKDGAHYNIFAIGPDHRVDAEEEQHSIQALRDFFEDGKADELNFCLFSTSGVHGLYATIEEVEKWIQCDCPEEWGDDMVDCITFLIVQPRTVTLRYGNVYPRTQDDIYFLKRLRQSSWDAIQQIGAPE